MLKVSDYFNIDQIPIDDLKNQYIDFNSVKINFNFGDRLLFNKGEIISENAE